MTHIQGATNGGIIHHYFGRRKFLERKYSNLVETRKFAKICQVSTGTLGSVVIDQRRPSSRARNQCFVYMTSYDILLQMQVYHYFHWSVGSSISLLSVVNCM